MRNSFVVLALAVIVSSGCISNSNSSPEDVGSPANQSSASTELETENNTVYLTSSGFTPSAITVQQGDTVTWINNASTPMEVAADRHPTHTQYAGSTRTEHCQGGDQNAAAFDQCSTGESFSFTFEKTGEWRYHNHERASQTGTVNVVG